MSEIEDYNSNVRMIWDFKPGLRKKVKELSSPLGTEVAIWKWVRDQDNFSDVKEIAARWLLAQYKLQKRAEARLEEARVRTAALEESRKRIAERTPEENQEIILKNEETMKRWREENQIRVEQNQKELREKKQAVLQQISAKFGVRDSDISMEQLLLVDLGFPVEFMLFGEDRLQQKSSVKHWDGKNKWLAEYGYRGKRKDAMKAIEESDNSEFGFFRHVDIAFKKYEEELKVEWTNELLVKTFQADGVTVSWADATVEQHKARAEFLRDHAIGTLDTAQLHLSAIHDIESNSVSSLGEMQVAA